MQARRLLLSVLAVTLVCGLIAGPASAATKADKKQNKALKALNKRTKNAGKKLDKVAADLGKLSGDLGSIQAAVPTVISSLTQLGDAAKQLKAGLEQAGAGLTLLKDNFTGYVSGAEYGVVQLYIGNTPAPGQLLVSSDIPDDANQATVSGRLLAQVPANLPATDITLKAAIRSGEKDGTGAANPVGTAGLMAMNATNIAGATISGGHPLVGTGAPLTSAPNAQLGGAPVYPIADKAPRSDATPNPFAFPDAQSIDLTDPATLLDAGTGPPTKFKVATGGTPGAIMVDVTVRFNDLSASATDLNE
jgi:hypothetical protein